MSRYDIPMWATLALASGPALFWRSFRHLRLQRLMQNTPSSRIRSMSMGLVEVNGRAESRSVLTSPFGRRPCAYWELDVSTRRRGGWVTVHRNSSGHPFFLRDETGLALVYPHGATCTIGYQVEETCNGLSLPDLYADYFRDQRLALSALWRLGQIRFRERVLEDQQQAYVLGTAMPRARAYTISDGEALAATGTDDARAHRVQALAEEAVAIIRRGENEQTFIISQQSERDLTAQLGVRAMLELIAGPALTLLGLGYWLYVLKSGRLY
jgi:hypothetical protein